MLICSFCSEEGTFEDFEIDQKYGRGFWCESCDSFNYFSKVTEQHKFTLILEDKYGDKPSFITSPTKLRKQLSPLRYPGGKSKLIDYLYSHLQKEKTDLLVSPFTGGGSFELAMLDAGIVNRLHLNDLDYGVYSLWWTILHAPYALTEKIKGRTPTHEEFYRAQKIINTNFYGVNSIDAAWATLIVNRLAYSGIAKANPLGGRKGSQQALLSRWNPSQLIQRLEHIHSFSDKITVTQEKATDLIEEAYWKDDCTIFIDPPYVAKGKALYNCFYTREDHIELCVLLDSLFKGMPGADLILTYDYSTWIEKLYSFPEIQVIGRSYSI
jgi:DNA adenine methylase